MATATSLYSSYPPIAKEPSLGIVGHGFDLHRLEPGYPLIIGGIDVPRDRGCEAHSDGDVLLHCVVDAVLGALGLPDIGQIFPDSDPKWKGAPSSDFYQRSLFDFACHYSQYRFNRVRTFRGGKSLTRLEVLVEML
ncbi:2-C-METHYL-D-ERYTHRITOL 24-CYCLODIPHOSPHATE SYNTHASE [Salix purpurea]|uniref:2-C-methyl-D-erythritol 2,4-cyclodiphosphate synthase n=1 Tax=Salix purpurea TaxID=77065 RepID=A0A9Q0YWJ2_SALPP|nr:2-C-METHYL-D-ERYTHRITOL 24-CYCLODIPHOSPHATE SYNTHASE [Salix purpurea]